MTKWYCVVNRHKAQANRKNGTDEPVLRVSKGKYGKPEYFDVVNSVGAKLVQDRQHPMPCGATVWLESEEPFT